MSKEKINQPFDDRCQELFGQLLGTGDHDNKKAKGQDQGERK